MKAKWNKQKEAKNMLYIKQNDHEQNIAKPAPPNNAQINQQQNTSVSAILAKQQKFEQNINQNNNRAPVKASGILYKNVVIFRINSKKRNLYKI